MAEAIGNAFIFAFVVCVVGGWFKILHAILYDKD